ncbi:class I SAM-dependent methyltransferase [Kibdelosporangium persicum]|uniref:Class I SAM-dependent methyltransferase n=1 Tax=Kibdelosporangium persicum TaxID=2698649 RepID=A0ABX2F9K5_9PSEU|nr:class I SAM-dependent methyltransferase [Kibdelosporangium persicum]NRN68044.1 Class I SAM-dependent methyltransferase [Kibdelosporangium persicum]
MLEAFRRTVRAEASRVVDKVARRVVRELEPVIRREVDRTIQALAEAEFRARRDMLVAGERDAALAAAKFVEANMPVARSFSDPESTLRYALEIAPPEGMALEFGVFQGRSLKIIAAVRSGDVYGFDSFKGLPEDFRSHVREGAFALDAVPEVPGAQLVVGWFDDTLPGFLAEHSGPVGFLHVDGDLYSSTKTVFDLVGPRLRVGSVVLFDEFFNYPGWEKHEFRAWQEFLSNTGTEASYEAYTMNNEQVVARITKLGEFERP